MATIVNDRDLILQAISPRLVPVTLPANIIIPAVKAILLTAPSTTFQITTGGIASPSSILLTATLKQVTGGISFSIVNGSGTLTGVTGNTATLVAPNMVSTSVTVRASVTESGVTYSSDFTVAKVADGANGSNGTNGTSGVNGAVGTRGNVAAQYVGAFSATAAANAVYAITSASGAVPATPIKGDIVSYTGGAQQCVAAGNPGTWGAVGAYIDGSLVVAGTVVAANIISSGDINITGGAKISGSKTATNYSGQQAAIVANDSLSAARGVIGLTNTTGAQGVVGYSLNAAAYGGYFGNLYAGGLAIQIDGVMKMSDSTMVVNLNSQIWNGATWSSFTTGSATATFLSGNKPGSNSSNAWMPFTVNGTTYYIPVWF